MLLYNTKLKKYSQELRKNMTETEKLVWSTVRGRQVEGLQFYRQRIIGNYIVDFYCPRVNLIIEIDGGQHYTDEGVVPGDFMNQKYFGSGRSDEYPAII
jgi:very-short-patch-repair endonuclease